MYFLRIDFIYRGSPVQRVRTICSSFAAARQMIKNYLDEDFIVLQVKIERCA